MLSLSNFFDPELRLMVLNKGNVAAHVFSQHLVAPLEEVPRIKLKLHESLLSQLTLVSNAKDV